MTGLTEEASSETDETASADAGATGEESQTDDDPAAGSGTGGITLADLPVANAGGDLTTISPNGVDATVFLDGSASIGNLDTITWTRNGALLGTGPNGVIVLPIGRHEIVLRIFGTGSDSGVFDEDTRVVRVIFNPTADAGADQTVKADNILGATVTLDGTGSAPTGDATLAVFRWSTPTEPNFAFGATPSVFLPVGTTTLTLTVTDSDSLSATDTVDVTVVVPVARAGADQTVDAASPSGAFVFLDGSGSVGSNLSYNWSTSESSTIASTVSALVLFPIGETVVTLTVLDDQSRTDTDTVVINVVIPTGPPTITLGDDRRTVGSSVGFEIHHFPPSSTVTVDLVRDGLAPIPVGSVTTDILGAGDGSFTVPITPGGAYSVRMSSGDTVESANLEIVPRIVVTPAGVVPGAGAQVNLTGFAANETVNLRWRVNGVWTPVGSIQIGSSGSGSAGVTVPANAAAGQNSVRGDGPNSSAQTNAVTVVAPAIELDKTRATVGSSVIFTIVNFPPDTDVAVTWRRPGGSTLNVYNATTDETGRVVGTIVVPATEGGDLNRITIAGGGVSVSTSFDVAPRILVTPQTVSPGDQVNVSLRGYAKQETVRIRWRVNGVWVEVATIVTSNTGSANVLVTVPANADIGQNSVRGDGPINRQQTNAVTVVAPE